MKKILLFFLLIAYSIVVSSKEVSMADAKKIADNFMALKVKTQIVNSNIIVFQKDKFIYTYLVNFQPEGWAILSADDRAQSVVAYSESGKFDTLGIKQLPFYFWFEGYAKQIKDVIESKSLQIHPSWNIDYFNKKNTTAVDPLISVTWNQGSGWNAYCPIDSRGPGGRVYAGCVAVAMAQCMSVYKHPTKGVGERQYNHSIYGTQYVNFSNAEYNWNLMSDNQSSNEIAKLLYHLGVSVSMNYGYDGSGAYSTSVPNAIKSYFDYSSKAQYVKKSDYTVENAWEDLLIEELSNGRPIFYSGDGGDGQAGHAFNVDGVNEQRMFHFNWGWSGSYNGYFSLNSLTPGSNNFSVNQAAVIYFMPRDHKPYDILLSNNSVKEKLPANTVVGTITVLDDTPNDQHTLEITGALDIDENPTQVPFTILDNKIVTTEELSFSTIPMYEVVVKATDLDGNTFSKPFLISVIKNVTNSIFDNEVSEFNLYYMNEKIVFNLNSKQEGRFTVSVFDILGRLVQENNFYKSGGVYTNSIDIKPNSSGVFIVSLKFSDNKGISKKVIIE